MYYFLKKNKKKGRKNKILMSCFWLKCITILLFFFMFVWSFEDTVGIRGEGNFPPRRISGTGMGQSLGSKAGKQPPHIPRPVDIPKSDLLTSEKKLLSTFEAGWFHAQVVLIPCCFQLLPSSDWLSKHKK
jgi:hypothetical protein